MPPEISVIVPYRNEAAYLASCIEALLQQDSEPSSYELIFVDNGSTDHSRSIVESYPQLISLVETEPGPYHARNCGLRRARGRLIAFTDADCRVNSDWLRQLELALAEADLVLGAREFPPGPWLSVIADFENDLAAYRLALPDRRCISAYTNNLGVRAEVFEKAGPFRPFMRGGDTEFVTRVVSQQPEARVLYAPSLRVEHLEVRTVLDWLWHMYAYGQAHDGLVRQSQYQPTNWRAVLAVASRLIWRYRGGPRSCSQLLFYLLAGRTFFLAGRLATWLEGSNR